MAVREFLARHPRLRNSMRPLLPAARAVVNLRSAGRRALLAHFDNVVSGELELRVPGLPGTYLVDARSELAMRVLVDGDYEADVIDCLRRRCPQGDALNIGANSGFFTCLLAEIVGPEGRVLAVEPTPGAFARLELNVARNGFAASAKLVQAVCGEQPGTYTLYGIAGKDEYASLGASVHNQRLGPASATEVPGYSLDDLVQEHGLVPRTLVIDVEGAEMKVFRGAMETIARHVDLLVAELDHRLLEAQGSSVSAVLDLLASLGFHVTTLTGRAVPNTYQGNVVASKPGVGRGTTH